MPPFVLPFEKPIAELQDKLAELRRFSESQDIDVSSEVQRMESRVRELRHRIYEELTPWQKVLVARHPQRPYTRDYIAAMTTDFVELHGDRRFAEDRALVGGFARIGGQAVMILGTQKGRDTKSNLLCHFGCAYPEGYRKALRLMQLAAKFNVPVVTLIDTPGAYPGLQSEERHIAEAIAVNLREMFALAVPVVACVIGEGGSGGALGIGIGDRILMLSNAYYSVISPEGCAAILWKDRAYADRAAEALKLTAKDLLAAGLVDEIVPEPDGGAHADPKAASEALRAAIRRSLEDLCRRSASDLLDARYARFRGMGVYEEPVPGRVPDLAPVPGPEQAGTGNPEDAGAGNPPDDAAEIPAEDAEDAGPEKDAQG